jgi:trimethylamine-N-oxide reductase (cytochrome c)
MTENSSQNNPLPKTGRLITATHWGIVLPQVTDGCLTALLPVAEDAAPSPVLKELAKLPDSRDRILYPAVRKSYLENGAGSRERSPGEEFVRVSWDTALSLLSGEIDRVYRDFGPSAVYGKAYGWKSAGLLHSAAGLQRRLLNLCGGFLETVNSYSTAAISTIQPYVVGSADPKSESWESLLKNSELLVFWGADPLITNDVEWGTTLHRSAAYFRKLKELGIPTVSVNPIHTETARFLNSEWISPRPGTDTALMLALISVLDEEHLIDRTFIDRYVYGWDVFMRYVRGKTDGCPKTPGWASGITGLEEDAIRLLARRMKSRRTKILMGWGIQRTPFGEQAHWVGYALACALGQMALPGGGIGTNYNYSSGGAPAHKGVMAREISARVKPVRPCKAGWTGSRVIPVARFADCILNPGKTIDHNGKKVTYPKIRLVVWSGGNPFAHQPGTFRLQKAWERPETIAVIDSVWTPTAKHADIVLPASTVFERNDLSFIGTYSNDGIAAMKKVLEPRGEAKSDFEIYSELAERLGIFSAFTEGLNEAGWIRRIYENARNDNKQIGVELPEFEQFWEEGMTLYPEQPGEQDYRTFSDFFEDPEKNPLKTESGKIQIFSPRIASYGYADCQGFPKYLAADESLPGTRAEDELAFLSTKTVRRLHSQLDGVHSESDAGPEPCWIHPEEAEKRGIKEGDIVRVFNSRGALLARAHVTGRIRRECLLVRHGAWFTPAANGMPLDVRGCANSVTEDRPTSALSCGNIASGGLVRAEKVRRS